MNEAVKSRLASYKILSVDDETNALREMIQEIALVGLWRAKFFEKAAFYGGTALRILHNLPRFSEDLDFSLLETNHSFDISKYENELTKELHAFCFEVDIIKKPKPNESTVDSAFIKANTIMLKDGAPGVDRGKVCAITISLYDRILQLPEADAAMVLRSLAEAA